MVATSRVATAVRNPKSAARSRAASASRFVLWTTSRPKIRSPVTSSSPITCSAMRRPLMLTSTNRTACTVTSSITKKTMIRARRLWIFTLWVRTSDCGDAICGGTLACGQRLSWVVAGGRVSAMRNAGLEVAGQPLP
jgi:hypothetical protein